MRVQVWSVSLVVCCVIVFSLPIAADDVAEQHRRIYQDAVADPNNQSKVDAFIATLVEAPRGSGKYIVEGDIVLARTEIQSYLKNLRNPSPRQISSEELIVNLSGGKFDYLENPMQRKMTYVLDRPSFPSPQNAELVRNNFRRAADEWEATCPECGVQFIEASQADVARGTARPYFVVKYEDADAGPIARAFFPSSAPDERSVAVFPGYFDPNLAFDPVGVFRHEIGHILGYRHEHIRNIPGCYTEGSEWKPLTPYTPNSVMHYFCGGGGSMDLSIREADKKGHRCLYLTGQACDQ
jgi:hypothetical protein